MLTKKCDKTLVTQREEICRVVMLLPLCAGHPLIEVRPDTFLCFFRYMSVI